LGHNVVLAVEWHCCYAQCCRWCYQVSTNWCDGF